MKAVCHRHTNKKAQYLRFSFASDFILFILSSFSWSNLTCFQWHVFLGAFVCSCVWVNVFHSWRDSVCVAVILHHPLKTHTHYLSLYLQCVCVLWQHQHTSVVNQQQLRAAITRVCHQIRWRHHVCTRHGPQSPQWELRRTNDPVKLDKWISGLSLFTVTLWSEVFSKYGLRLKLQQCICYQYRLQFQNVHPLLPVISPAVCKEYIWLLSKSIILT